MNALEREIRALIESEGPLPVSRYVALCLTHPEHGYYTTRDPFGVSGDFTTAPEISQMFGELIGLWAAEVWRLMGSPARLTLAELGPGRGTLMKDALRAANAVPRFAEAIEVHLIDASPALQEVQRQTLAAVTQPVTWHADTASLPASPLIAIGNELVDALPFNQFMKRNGKWHERRIGFGPGGELAFGLAPLALPDFEESVPTRLAPAPDGAILERRDLSPLTEILTRIRDHGGVALFVDYGHAETGFGDTLQAVAKHDYAEPLENPGEYDLTAQVDFEALASIAPAGVAAQGTVSQGAFLRTLGIDARAEILQRNAKPELREEIAASLQRLTGPAPAMGDLFKALAFASAGLPPLPGFDGAKIARER